MGSSRMILDPAGNLSCAIKDIAGGPLSLENMRFSVSQRTERRGFMARRSFGARPQYSGLSAQSVDSHERIQNSLNKHSGPFADGMEPQGCRRLRDQAGILGAECSWHPCRMHVMLHD
uniref:Uncharacterized protein n=1 Tax=Coccidioides posadasii RMSCC 3488 TaxID=454284 RepID=A0A0J6ETW7_COCPO|nr:hypothetical protein CPAG_00328 [Coccidioides posadasii RMSCC 3488]